MARTGGASDRRPSLGDVVPYLVGVAGLAACLTVLFLSMRAVMDIGGTCAEGGPYVIERPCPQGVPLLLVGSIFGLFLFGGLSVAKGAPLGGGFAVVVLLAWPALFVSLGWNFLEYAVRPPGGGGIVLGWLIPGIIFVVMGAGPLLLPLLGRGRPVPGSSMAARIRQRQPDAPITPERGSAAGPGLADGLERLAGLHRSGDLTDAEYEAAKSALIREAAAGR